MPIAVPIAVIFVCLIFGLCVLLIDKRVDIAVSLFTILVLNTIWLTSACNNENKPIKQTFADIVTVSSPGGDYQVYTIKGQPVNLTKLKGTIFPPNKIVVVRKYSQWYYGLWFMDGIVDTVHVIDKSEQEGWDLQL